MADTDTFPYYRFARLVRQANLEGASFVTLGLLIAEASYQGASRALERWGLHVHDAGRDIGELRALLDAWRDTKRTARRSMVRWLISTALAAMMVGAAIKVRLLQLS